MMKGKGGQHEIAGFVIIVVIVTLIGVAFLSLAFRPNEKSKQTSVEISNLLQSVMYYTSECGIGYEPPYKDGQDLVKLCYRNPQDKCLNGKNVCEEMNFTLRNLIGTSLQVGDDRPNKAYRISIYYAKLNSSYIEDNQNKKDFFFPTTTVGKFGNCSSIYGGGHQVYISESKGAIFIELDVCRGKI